MRRFVIGLGVGLVIGSAGIIVGLIALLRVPVSSAAATAEPMLVFETDRMKAWSLTIEPGAHVRFRYRVIVHPAASQAALTELYKEYATSRGTF